MVARANTYAWQRWTFVFCASLLVAGCGGDSTGPSESTDDGSTRVASTIDIVQGDDQSAPVTEWMSDSVIVQVLDDQGQPISSRLVVFDVDAQNGSFETDSLRTDSEGRVATRLQAGEVAWTGRMVTEGDSAHVARVTVRRDGRPNLVETFQFTVDPGPIATTFGPNERSEGGSPRRVTFAADEFGNPALVRAEADSVTVVEGTVHGTPDAMTLVGEEIGDAVICVRDDVGNVVTWGIAHVRDHDVRVRLDGQVDCGDDGCSTSQDVDPIRVDYQLRNRNTADTFPDGALTAVGDALALGGLSNTAVDYTYELEFDYTFTLTDGGTGISGADWTIFGEVNKGFGWKGRANIGFTLSASNGETDAISNNGTASLSFADSGLAAGRGIRYEGEPPEIDPADAC